MVDVDYVNNHLGYANCGKLKYFLRSETFSDMFQPSSIGYVSLEFDYIKGPWGER